MQARPQAHVSGREQTRPAHLTGKRLRGVGVSTPCTLLWGRGHFLGGQRRGARPVFFSDMRNAELLLFWSTPEVHPDGARLVVSDTQALETRAGTPLFSLPSQAQPAQPPLWNPDSGCQPCAGTGGCRLVSVNGLLVRADWAGLSRQQMVISPRSQGRLQLRSGLQTAPRPPP